MQPVKTVCELKTEFLAFKESCNINRIKNINKCYLTKNIYTFAPCK